MEHMEDFHLSNKNPWAGIGILIYMQSKLARKLNFHAFASTYAKCQSLVFYNEYNLDQGNDHEH